MTDRSVSATSSSDAAAVSSSPSDSANWNHATDRQTDRQTNRPTAAFRDAPCRRAGQNKFIRQPLRLCEVCGRIVNWSEVCTIAVTRWATYVTKPTRSTQPCIPLGSLNRVPALIGWGKGGNVTSAGWQVVLCDPMWHVSSRSGVVLVAQTAIRFLTHSTLGDRSFSVAAPWAWNTYARTHVRHISSIDVLSKNLQSFLFAYAGGCNCHIFSVFYVLYSRVVRRRCYVIFSFT